MKITRIAATPDQNQRQIDKMDRQIDSLKREFKKSARDLTADIKGIKKDIKEVQQVLKNLNIGNRLFFQHKTVFTTLQRKMEKLESVETEWKRYKETLDNTVQKMLDKQKRARVKV